MSKTNSKIIQAELRVSRKEYISPHYIRIFLTGPDIAKYANTTVGLNNKILIPPAGVDKIYFPEFDDQKKEWKPIDESIRPSVRTYTHRGIDLTSNEMWIDFVAHGMEGPASAWAIAAQEGDVLGVLMKDGKTQLYSPAQNYLLVADATGIPVIAAILEDLPSSVSGLCLLEVRSKEDEQLLKTQANIDFVWIHNAHPQQGSSLSDILQQQQLPAEDRFGYVAAEFTTVKSIRQYLRKEKEWKQEELYAFSYWKSGFAEDKSASDRRSEKEE